MFCLVENFPPPVKYNLQNYMNQISSNPGQDYQLRPFSMEDMATTAKPEYDMPQEIKQWGWTPQYENNPTKLGKPLTDEEFKKHMGITW